MELKDKYAALKNILGVTESRSFSVALMDCVIGRSADIYEKYLDLLPDLSRDELRECWQFWHADREEKKQDYTSDELAALVGALAVPSAKIADLCAGSGSLSIGAWNYNHNLSLVCEELDEEVIPLLLFNLAVRNIDARVHCTNILTGETYHTWTVSKGAKFGSVQAQMFPDEKRDKVDAVICNPPFNLRADGKLQNYAFVRKALSYADKAVFILPTGCFTNVAEQKDRCELLENGKVRAVISMPAGFFSATGVAVSLAVFGESADGVELIDAETLCGRAIRDQRGEGSASHANRIYHKEVRTLTASQISGICGMIENRANTEVCGFINSSTIAEKGYSLQFGPYKRVDLDEAHTMHRAYTDIIKDLNRITRLRNTMKVVCNKVWLAELGLTDLLQMSEQSAELTKSLNEQLATIGIEDALDSVDYLSSSNSKELIIRQADKEILSPVIDTFVRLWAMHIRTMNTMENGYLAELRDALLPALMTGAISFKNE